MIKFLPFTAFVILCQWTHAQSATDAITGNFSSDLVYSVKGRAAGGRYENIKKGTPYFINEWLPATVTLFDGKQFDHVMAKMDLLEHKFLYREKEVEYIADSPVKDVILNDTVNGKKYHFIHTSAFPYPIKKDDNGWYLMLSSGNVSAYKFISKKIEESSQYSSAIIDRSVESSERYFISYKNVLLPVKRLRDVPDILRDRESELTAYISKHGLNKVSDDVLQGIVSYYNSLGK